MEEVSRQINKMGEDGMKGIAFALMLAALLSCAAAALGEIGFAEVIKDNVNLRQALGGERICYLDAGYDVYVFEEKVADRRGSRAAQSR